MYKNLNAEMARYSVTKADIKALWNCSERTVDNKLDGTSNITYEEAALLRDTYFEGLRLEYLFKASVA